MCQFGTRKLFKPLWVGTYINRGESVLCSNSFNLALFTVHPSSSPAQWWLAERPRQPCHLPLTTKQLGGKKHIFKYAMVFDSWPTSNKHQDCQDHSGNQQWEAKTMAYLKEWVLSPSQSAVCGRGTRVPWPMSGRGGEGGREGTWQKEQDSRSHCPAHFWHNLGRYLFISRCDRWDSGINMKTLASLTVGRCSWEEYCFQQIGFTWQERTALSD